MKNLKTLVEKWLSDNDMHLATHSGANYHYLTSNKFNYSRYSSYPSSIDAAIEDGSIYFRDNSIHICGEVIIAN